jgi:hypothetical protein
MPTHGLTRVLAARLDEMAQRGRLKGRESAICAVISARDGHGPRYLIEDAEDTPYLRMNSNSYLGMALRSEVIETEEKSATWRGALHQRDLVTAYRAGAAARRVSRPFGRHAVLVGLCRGEQKRARGIRARTSEGRARAIHPPAPCFVFRPDAG